MARRDRRFRRKLPGLAFAIVGLLAAGAALAAEPSLRIAGPAEIVFGWATDRCARDHTPDAPARAFRDADGRVHLFATHFVNRAMVGPNLDGLAVDCRVRFRAGGDNDPAAFDDKTWLAAFHTDEGRIVHALGHHEFEGHRRRDLCPAGDYKRCWRNAVVQLRSEDGGRTFTPAGPGPAPPVVASLPYPFDGDQRSRTGYFNPSNIIRHDGHAYVFVFAERTGDQRRGPCLLRTDRIDDPGAWRAWDGRSFSVRFVDPYRSPGAAPARHVCRPIEGIGFTISSVVRDDATGRFVAVMTGSLGGTPGVLVATSDDLIRWTAPRMLLAVPLMYAFACGASEAFAYPSLLDPGSRSRNFETIGALPYLYLTRFRLTGCRLGLDRDLVRYPLAVAADPPG
jgi:hypothetical protein